MSDKPRWVAYQVCSFGDNQKSKWIEIGRGFPHKNGGGMDVVLNALPLPDRGKTKIVLRKFTDDDAAKVDSEDVPF